MHFPFHIPKVESSRVEQLRDSSFDTPLKRRRRRRRRSSSAASERAKWNAVLEINLPRVLTRRAVSSLSWLFLLLSSTQPQQQQPSSNVTSRHSSSSSALEMMMRQADDAPAAAAATVLISSTSFLTAAAAAQFYIYCLSLDHFLFLLLLFRFLLQLFVSPTFTFSI